MQYLFQSTFLQALGFAIANSLWQMALVWLVFVCLNSLSLPAAVKYRFAVAAQLTGFLWFMVTLQFYYAQYPDTWHQNAFAAGLGPIQQFAPVNHGFSSQLIRWIVKGEQLLPFVSVAYLLLMLFLCIRWFMGYRQTQLIRHQGLQKISVDWRLFVKKIAAQLGIKKEIRLYLSDRITTPLTIGFLKPIILVPVASINHLTTDQLEAVLLHELAHIKRYDYLLNMVLSVVEISLFFNPFTQLLSKSICKERENSCDDWVLQFRYNASEYADALLRIACLQSAPAFAMTAATKKNELLVRVKRIIAKKENRFNYQKQLLAFVIVTGMLSSIAWFNPISPSHPESATPVGKVQFTQKNNQPLVAAPTAMKIDNPLFNPVFFLSEPLKAEIEKSMSLAKKEMDALMPATREKKSFAESIPPMIADALEKASFEMGEKNPAWEKETGRMEFEKMNFEKVFKFDSISWSKNVWVPLKKNLAKSLSSMQKDIEKAKIEMNRALKVRTEIHIDQEKIQKDIRSAMEDLNKLDLEKIISQALGVPDQLSGNGQPERSKKIRTAETERIKIPVVPLPENEFTAPDNDPEPGMANGNYAEIAALITPAVLAKLASLSNTPDAKNGFAKIILIKNMLKELKRLQGNQKIVPVIFRERNRDDNKVVIQLR